MPFERKASPGDLEAPPPGQRNVTHAPSAVVRAAVIYVLRSLVAERIPPGNPQAVFLGRPYAFNHQSLVLESAATEPLRQLPADFVLLDLGAGTHSAVMDYFMVGEGGLIVVSPEPTSVENAYSFLRAAFYRRLRLAMASHEMREVVVLAMDQHNERGIRTPLDLLREIEDEGCILARAAVSLSAPRNTSARMALTICTP